MKICILRQIIALSKYCLCGAIIQFVTFSLLTAKSVEAQKISIENLPINISGNTRTLASLFDEIREKTAFGFAFNRKAVDLQKNLPHR